MTTATAKGKRAKAVPVRIWREQAISEDWLFRGTDEAGRSGWFLRISISGMYPRRLGPYDSKEDALAAHECLLDDVVTPLMNIENDLKIWQTCVLEGVPTLVKEGEERPVRNG